MNFYLDESGDLGWTFDKPIRKGGSSRYLTISGFIVEEEHEKHIVRFILEMYSKYGLKNGIEKKGASFSSDHCKFITSQLNKIKSKAPSFKIITITVYKPKVNEALRKDKNIFYNYVLSLLVRQQILNCDCAKIFIDQRTIKVSHGQSFPDYIKTVVWGDDGCNIDIDCEFINSYNNKMIWFADWYSNWVWRRYENNDCEAYNLLNKLPLSNFFIEKKLFFP